MKYLVDITPKQAQTIQKLLDSGVYASLSQFISASIENQLSLEESGTTDLKPFKLESLVHAHRDVKTETKVTYFEKYKLTNISDFNSVVVQPEYKNLVFSSESAQKIPENQTWIWGQINKIFPVKLGLRILHQLLADKQTIELDEFFKIVVAEAVSVGDIIRQDEENNSKLRHEKISAGLPSLDSGSQTRYKFQFMVYPRRDGLLDGALALMHFCNILSDKKKQFIGITKPGLKFSLIENPVLDKNDFNKSLSEEESLFYINHVKENIKGEFAAMHWLLMQIENGKNETDSLNKEIEDTYGEVWSATPAVINTQRAGLTARMTELGLIERDKEGVRVKYRVSEFGKKHFL